MMSDKPPKVQDISGEAVRQLPDQRVEDNAFHLGALRLTFNASKKLDQFLQTFTKAFPCILRSPETKHPRRVRQLPDESNRFSNPQGCASVNVNSKR
jgi:hypothetical protein